MFEALSIAKQINNFFLGCRFRLEKSNPEFRTSTHFIALGMDGYNKMTRTHLYTEIAEIGAF